MEQATQIELNLQDFKMKNIFEMLNETVGDNAYGSATLTTQGIGGSRFTKTGRPPGIWEAEDLPIVAKRLKDVFDQVGDSEFWKNHFKSKYGIPFPTNLKDINKEQALAMNKFGTHMKQNQNESNAEFEVGYKDGDTAIVSMDDKTAMKLKSKSSITKLKNLNTMAKLKGEGLNPEEENINQKINKKSDYYYGTTGNEQKKEFRDILSNFSKAHSSVYRWVRKWEDDENKAMRYLEEFTDTSYLANEQSLADLADKMNYTSGYSSGDNNPNTGSGGSEMDDDNEWLYSQPMGGKKPKQRSTDRNSIMEDYIKSRKGVNLMEQMDKHRKRPKLMEGAMKRFFKAFDGGSTDEELVHEYAREGLTVPEAFVSKARKQWESLKKAKLDLELSEKEAKGFRQVQTTDPTNVMGMEPQAEEKHLASGLFN